FAEIAFEMAGLDVAVEAFAAADTQFEARFDSTPIADRASAFSTAESAVSMLDVSVLIAALTEARSALMTTLIARSALRASAFNTALRAVSMLAASVLIAALTLAMSVLIAALVEAMWDASSARIAAETDVRSAFRTTLVEARCEATSAMIAADTEASLRIASETVSALILAARAETVLMCPS